MGATADIDNGGNARIATCVTPPARARATDGALEDAGGLEERGERIIGCVRASGATDKMVCAGLAAVTVPHRTGHALPDLEAALFDPELRADRG